MNHFPYVRIRKSLLSEQQMKNRTKIARWYRKDKADGIFTKQKFPLSVMVWGCMCQNGASLYFIEKDRKIDSEYYCNKILPFAKREGIV